MGLVAAFPGSFDPLTTAHLAIADAGRRQLSVDRVVLVISNDAIDKGRGVEAVAERAARIDEFAAARPWLSCHVTEHRLLVDIATEVRADWLIVGADKWEQLHETRFYGTPAARDAALDRLPRVAVAPRTGIVRTAPAPDHELSVPAWAGPISSSAVRAGRVAWLAEPTAPSDVGFARRGRSESPDVAERPEDDLGSAEHIALRDRPEEP